MLALVPAWAFALPVSAPNWPWVPGMDESRWLSWGVIAFTTPPTALDP